MRVVIHKCFEITNSYWEVKAPQNPAESCWGLWLISPSLIPCHRFQTNKLLWTVLCRWKGNSTSEIFSHYLFLQQVKELRVCAGIFFHNRAGEDLTHMSDLLDLFLLIISRSGRSLLYLWKQWHRIQWSQLKRQRLKQGTIKVQDSRHYGDSTGWDLLQLHLQNCPWKLIGLWKNNPRRGYRKGHEKILFLCRCNRGNK